MDGRKVIRQSMGGPLGPADQQEVQEPGSTDFWEYDTENCLLTLY